MNLNLTHKVALITGASKGLGHAIARALAAEGMYVAITARSEPPLRELATVIESAGGQALPLIADLAEPLAAKVLIHATLAKFGQLDLLVNNAGATKRGDFLSLTDEDWHNGYELKFHGAVRLCRHAWPHLMQSKGCVINIAGVGGRTASAEFTIGGSVNAAMSLFTKALADRGTQDGVRVNAINPGSIATDRLKIRIQKVADEEKISEAEATQRLAHRERTARFGEPREIGEAIAFLASERAAYIHGAIIDIDGGLTRAL